ncbi:hypothetical protein DFH06DRAFT_1186075 [Mycena polygramma]|nr:hypothetical protein DFH06DRAFT_1186075 [Mycena polygramma]
MATVNRVPAVVLPTELLADIFMMCLPLVVKAPWNVRVVEKPRILRPSDAPLLVASVCRRWRQVAISTPRLWLSLDLNSKRDTEGGVVAKWLERSLPYELSFALDRSTLPGMRKEVIRHCERWSVVEICVPECDPYVFDEVRGRLPCLTKLYLDCPHDVESFADAPQLRVVHIVSGFRFP